MFFVLSRAWNKDNILSPHEESIPHRDSELFLCPTLVTRRKNLSLFLYKAQNLPSLLFQSTLPNFFKCVKGATTQAPSLISFRSAAVYDMVSVAYFRVNCRLNNCLFPRVFCCRIAHSRISSNWRWCLITLSSRVSIWHKPAAIDQISRKNNSLSDR